MQSSFYAPGAFLPSGESPWVDFGEISEALQSPSEPEALPDIVACSPAWESRPECIDSKVDVRVSPANFDESWCEYAKPAASSRRDFERDERSTENGGYSAANTPKPATSSFSSSSFYPKSGSVGTSGNTSIPELPWTKREQFSAAAAFAKGGPSERSDSRERRHRSSWHASLNKRIMNIENAEDLLGMVGRELNGFDVLNTVTALNRFSRLRGAPKFFRDERILELLYRIESWLTRASGPEADKDGPEAVLPKHLASISIALARLHWKSSSAGRVLRMVVALAPDVLPMARPRDLSNMAWAFATLGLREHESVLLAIAREAVIQMPDFSEQNLSNTCWAYAKLGLRHDPLIKALADETLKKLPDFSAQGLTNTLWGFATLVIKGEELLGKSAWQLVCALLEELKKRLPECPTQQLSNSAWACCRLGVRHDGFMAAIAHEGMIKLPDYTCQDLANTAMAFAKPNINAQAFLRAMAANALQKIGRFEAREVSNLTWAFNIMGPGIIDATWLEPVLNHFIGLVNVSIPSQPRRDGDFEGWEMVQLLNAIWAYRSEVSLWPKLARMFQQHIYGPVVRALADVVGRGTFCSPEAARAAASSARALGVQIPNDGFPPTSSEDAPKLLNAGPKTDGALLAASRQPAPREPLDAARQRAQQVAEELQVDFLGPIFTRVALRDLGFIDPMDKRGIEAFGITPENDDDFPDWGTKARAAVAQALAKLKSELPFMWFDRFGPHERRVQCWINYHLEVELPCGSGPLKGVLEEAGRIADFSLDEHRAMCQHGMETFERLRAKRKEDALFTLQDVRQAQQWMQGLFAQHDRAGHAERQALLEVTLEIIHEIRRLRLACIDRSPPAIERCISEGFFDGSYGIVVRGHIRMFVCHFYCISCLAAISNFARRFQHVTLHTDYDDCWRTRLLDV